MKIIGCDFHPSYQQIAVWDKASGEVLEKMLNHERKEEVREFYAGLDGPAVVGIEASGQSQWFERPAAGIPAAGTEKVPCLGESGYGAEVGGAFVLDAARRSGLCAANPGFLCRAARVILWS
jgi:hypothetical protein